MWLEIAVIVILLVQINLCQAGVDNMSGGQVNLYYHLDDCQNAIDLLRNESPMYLLYSGSGGENGIKTTQEVVGEGEVQLVGISM